MRVNVYAEEMTDRVEIVEKDGFTGVRFWLAFPGENGKPNWFIHRPGDDDSSAVTFWGKKQLRENLRKALALLEDR